MSIGRIGGVDTGVTTLETFRYNATGGETSLSGTDAGGRTLIYPVNYEVVFLNGVRLVRGVDYTASTGSSITGLAALSSGDVVEIMVFQALDVADALSQGEADSYYVRKDLVDAKGDIVAATGADTVARLAVGSDGQILKANSATATGLEWAADEGGISPTIVDAKGDLIVASAADTVARVAVGSDGFVLTADSNESSGVKWAAASSGGVGFDAVFMLMGA